jgi:hypothetical protein
MWPGGSGAHAVAMFLHHPEMTRELVRTHQRELERDAAARRFTRIARRTRRAR